MKMLWKFIDSFTLAQLKFIWAEHGAQLNGGKNVCVDFAAGERSIRRLGW